MVHAERPLCSVECFASARKDGVVVNPPRCSLVFCAAIVIGLGAPSFAVASCLSRRVAQMPITLWQDKLFIPVMVNGTEEHLFIDTGAAVTTLSQEVASALTLPRNFEHTEDAIGVGGRESHLYIAQVQLLGIGALRIEGRSFPIAGFGQRLADGTPVGGLIGADILSRFDVEIDVPNRRLALWAVSGCVESKPDWAGMATEVPMQVLDSRHVTVPVRIDDTRLDLMLDTGSPGLVLSTRAAAQAGATPEILEQGRHLQGKGMNDRPFDAWLHIFRRLEIAGQVFGDARAIVVNNGRLEQTEGLLGLNYLTRGRVWLSYSTGALFMQAGRT